MNSVANQVAMSCVVDAGIGNNNEKIAACSPSLIQCRTERFTYRVPRHCVVKNIATSVLIKWGFSDYSNDRRLMRLKDQILPSHVHKNTGTDNCGVQWPSSSHCENV